MRWYWYIGSCKISLIWFMIVLVRVLFWTVWPVFGVHKGQGILLTSRRTASSQRRAWSVEWIKLQKVWQFCHRPACTACSGAALVLSSAGFILNIRFDVEHACLLTPWPLLYCCGSTSLQQTMFDRSGAKQRPYCYSSFPSFLAAWGRL
jgi:hypothetical protein